MNFLQLCQRLRQEARISGTGPSAVTGQTGEYLKVVNWIEAAYEDIQNEHKNWNFMLQPFSFAMTAGKRDYTPAEAGITDFKAWKFEDYGDIRCYLSVSDEQRLDFLPWLYFKDTYLIGSSRTTSGRPHIFSIEPDNTITVDVLPDAAYIMNGYYFQSADAMASNTDVPVFHEDFHMAIVWRALMFYGADYAAEERYAHGQNEYKKLLRKLELKELPSFTWGKPLV